MEVVLLEVDMEQLGLGEGFDRGAAPSASPEMGACVTSRHEDDYGRTDIFKYRIPTVEPTKGMDPL